MKKTNKYEAGLLKVCTKFCSNPLNSFWDNPLKTTNIDLTMVLKGRSGNNKCFY